MRGIIVGAGGTTRELLRRLGEVWEVVVVDTDAARLETAEGVRQCTVIVGDGSSAITLRDAGMADADAVIAATNDDDRNLEVVRLAVEAGVPRIVAVAADPERLPDYRHLGVQAFAPDQLTARHVEVTLEPRRVSSTAFADGKAEAIEFQITPDAPVRGKRLRDLHSETWVVAAMLRDGKLIVPHGSTVIEAGDRVTVVGAAAEFGGIVKAFTSGHSSFPLAYGRKVVVALDGEGDLEGAVGEAISFVRNSQAEQLSIVHRDPEAERDPSRAEEIAELLTKLEARTEGIDVELRPTGEALPAAVVGLAEGESVGTIVVPAPKAGRLLGRRRLAATITRYGAAGVPVLLARGRYPYTGVLAPARHTPSGELAGRAAIDVARSSGATLTGVAVVGPSFVSSVDTLDEARASIAWLREEAAVQGITIKRRVRRGNPVRVFEELAASESLLTLAMPPLPASTWRPGITGYLCQSVAISVLLVPPAP